MKAVPKASREASTEAAEKWAADNDGRQVGYRAGTHDGRYNMLPRNRVPTD
jgi:hypothetical protein